MQRKTNYRSSPFHLLLVALAALPTAHAQESAVGRSMEPTPGVQPRNLEFGLTTGVTWSDNVSLVPTNEEDGTIGEVGVDLLYDQQSRRLRTDLDLNAAYEHYFDDNFDDNVFGGLDGTMIFGVVPERFEWFLQDNFGQTRVNPLAGATPDNRENFNYLTTGPDFTLRFGRVTALRLAGRYSRTDYETASLDGDRYSGAISLQRNVSSASSVSLNAMSERVENDDTSLTDGYDRSEGYLRYELDNDRTDLGVDLGYTTIEDDTHTSSGPLVRLSLRRQMTPATAVALQLGDEFSDAGNVFRATQDLNGVSRDAESVLVTSDALERRFGYLGWSFERNRTEFGVNGEYSEENYENAVALDRSLARYSAYVSRRLTSNVRVRLDARQSKEEFDASNLDIDEWRGVAALDWEVGRTLSWRLQFEYREREGSGSNGAVASLQEYKESRASLFITWLPVGRR